MLPLLIQVAMEIDPDYGEVYFNYGNLLSDEGEYEAAAARYKLSLCLGPYVVCSIASDNS